ncbi:B12-binding domain-containing radical SAM protein [Pelosinus fermentans]|uniref:Radical SAM domain protein n=1 Tax=Pelosinus fermentans JBW45 TaxID=1192197 RepID=I9NRS1_9FIRM|nr:B12-binding domain-containing radical SAM protein [Pelosinus fermentans]AJQ26598.1 Radical SAM domain protein [Pelosinus fermentans JBW45]
MDKIDCLLIGHNQITGLKCERTSRVMWGRNSQFYKEAVTLRYIKYEDQLYTPTQISNKFTQKKNGESSFEHLSYEPTLNGAIAYLGSYLNKSGFTFDFINCLKSEQDKLASILKRNELHAVAISTSMYTTIFPILEAIAFIKKHNASVKIVIGGSFIANQVREQEEAELQQMFGVIGADVYIYSNEGEHTLVKVLRAIKEMSPYTDINNIFYKDLGKYSFTFPEEEKIGLDDNLINWNLFEGNQYKYVNVRTTVSCPFSCAFCGYPKYGGKYRQLSIEALEKQLNMIRENPKVKGIYFIDDTFNFPAERFKNILRMMIKNKYNFKWHSFFRCQYADRETVELMKESGCQVVYCGIESANQVILDNMNKNTTVEQYKKGISLLNEYGIANIASIIIGFPGETYQTYLDTYNFIEELGPTFFRSHVWYADAESPIYSKKKLYKLEESGYEWSHSTMDAKTAATLTDLMFLNIKNSVYDSDYPIAFDLLVKGYSIEQIKKFINGFNMCMKKGLNAPILAEADYQYIQEMKSALGSLN